MQILSALFHSSNVRHQIVSIINNESQVVEMVWQLEVSEIRVYSPFESVKYSYADASG